MLTTVLQATGVQTNTNKLSVQAGGLVQADNCVIDKKDVIELRRGFNPVGETFAFSGNTDNLYVYQGVMIVSNGSSLAYDSNDDLSDPNWTLYSGTYAPPDGSKPSSVRLWTDPTPVLYMRAALAQALPSF